MDVGSGIKYVRRFALLIVEQAHETNTRVSSSSATGSAPHVTPLQVEAATFFLAWAYSWGCGRRRRGYGPKFNLPLQGLSIVSRPHVR